MGASGDAAWVAAAVFHEGRIVASGVVRGEAGAPYAPGFLPLREGRLLEQALLALRCMPDVVLVNATGADHPRRAGLALHLGAVLDLPTLGVTDGALLATAPEPGPERGAAAPLLLDGELVGFRLRTRRFVRPLFVHAGWRTRPETARGVVMQVTDRSRTPEPIRRARQLARGYRSGEHQTRPLGVPLG